MASFLDSIAGAAKDLAKQADPELARSIDLVTQIVDAEDRHGYGALGNKAPGGKPSGFSFKKTNQYLEIIRWYQEHRWALPMGIAAILGLAFFAGRKSK